METETNLAPTSAGSQQPQVRIEPRRALHGHLAAFDRLGGACALQHIDVQTAFYTICCHQQGTGTVQHGVHTSYQNEAQVRIEPLRALHGHPVAFARLGGSCKSTLTHIPT